MNKKQHLINSLRIAVNALKNDTVRYNWSEQCSCNAGIVSQAVLNLTADELQEKRSTLFGKLSAFNKEQKDDKKLDLTWKNAIKIACPITGKNMPEIINDLEAAGLTREDIAHLEYLENPAILKASGIRKEVTARKIKVDEKVYTETLPSASFFGRLFGKTVTKTITEPVYREERVETYPKNYYTKKENLIMYLSAWIRILTEDVTMETDREKLEGELLNAVAEENYERASEIRNRLAIL